MIFLLSADLYRHSFLLFNLYIIMGLISGIIGAVAGAASQSEANKTNLQIAKETNYANQMINQANIDAAREMYDRQEAFNREIYEDQKIYNSASAQRDRLEAAGLNPYVMMSGGSAGTASSTTAPSYSQPSQIPMQAAKVSPVLSAADVSNIGSMIDQSRLIDAQIDKTKAEANLQWQDANYRDTMLQLNAAKIISELSNIDSRTKSQVLDNFVKQSTADYTIQSAKNDADYSFNRARSMALQVSAQKAQLPYIGPTAAAQLDNIVAGKLLTDAQRQLVGAQTITEQNKPALMSQQIALMISQGKLSEQQAAKAYADALYTNKQRLNLPNLTRDQCDALGRALVDSSVNAAFISDVGADKAGWYFRQPEKQKDITNFLESAGRAILPWK